MQRATVQTHLHSLARLHGHADQWSPASVSTELLSSSLAFHVCANCHVFPFAIRPNFYPSGETGRLESRHLSIYSRSGSSPSALSLFDEAEFWGLVCYSGISVQLGCAYSLYSTGRRTHACVYPTGHRGGGERFLSQLGQLVRLSSPSLLLPWTELSYSLSTTHWAHSSKIVLFHPQEVVFYKTWPTYLYTSRGLAHPQSIAKPGARLVNRIWPSEDRGEKDCGKRECV